MPHDIQNYHHILNRALANAPDLWSRVGPPADHHPVQLKCELVKANVSQQRVFLEVASQGYRLQCGTSSLPGRKPPAFKPGESLVLDVTRPPKVWRNGNVGLWLPTQAIHRSETEDANAKEVRREQNLSTLKKHSLLEKQKDTHLLRKARRIFLVTAKKSDAYADFCDELEKTVQATWDIHTLDTVVQGRECIASVQRAFQYIQTHGRDADVVVLTRGGGSPEDLVAFDTLAVAQCVAKCPLPVLSAIGHHRDNNLCDKVAYHACKTPTAAATYLVHHMQLLCNPLERQLDYVKRLVARNCEQRKHRLIQYKHRIARLRAARPLARRLRVAERLAHIHTLAEAARQARTIHCTITTLAQPKQTLSTTKTLAQHANRHVRITLPSGWFVEGILAKDAAIPDTM